jgi:hypothetical protein
MEVNKMTVTNSNGEVVFEIKDSGDVIIKADLT